MNPPEFLQNLAEELGHEFSAISRFKKWTNNSDLKGTFAEACVRTFVSRVVRPAYVSTGAVISPRTCNPDTQIAQLDTMIWTPREAPALFDTNGFALVPHGSCHGVLEIKRSSYRGAGENLQALIERRDEFYDEYGPADHERVLGVFCIQADGPIERAEKQLIDDQKAVLLLKRSDDGYQPNLEGIIHFVNYLIGARRRALEAMLRPLRMNPAALPSSAQKVSARAIPSEAGWPSTNSGH